MQKGYNLYNLEPQFKNFLAAENISAISLKNYLSDFRHFAGWLDFYLSSHPTLDTGDIATILTPNTLSEYRGYLVENKLPHKTINRRLSTVRRFCSFCISQGWLKENPAKKISNIGQKFSLESAKTTGLESKKQALQGPNFFSSFWEGVKRRLQNRKPSVTPTSASVTLSSTKGDSRFSLGIQHYIGLIIILVFMATLGAGIYNQFFAKSQPSLAYPTALTRAGRLLSFQGRLTDSLGNSITTATNITYKLYNVSTGGTALYTAGACSTTPDQDGIFSTLIGGSGYSPTPPQAVCGSEIDSSIFSENANVYLGVTVASDSEMTPRQQIANVGYAINAETLQGFPPGTGTSTVPYINSDGNVLIAASNPDIASTYASSTFTISSANATTIQSAGSGDITLQATESGAISLRTGGSTSTYTRIYVDTSANGGNVGIGTITPLEKLDVNGNATVSGNLTLAGGARTIASRAFNQLNIGDSQTGDILISPGTGKQVRFFNTSNYVDSSGNLVLAGDVTVGGGNINTGNIALTVGDATTDSITLSTDGTGNGEVVFPNDSIGPNEIFTTGQTDEYCLTYETTGATWEWQTCGSGGGGESLWTIANGSIYPLNSTVDLFVGGTATTSAKFKVLNINSGTPTASISGSTANVSTFVDGNGNISTTNRADLVLGNSSTYNSTGNVLVNPNGTGNVGIGTTTPGYKLDVAGTSMHQNTAYFANGTTYYVDSSGNAKFNDLIVADTGNPGLTVGDGATGYAKVGSATIGDAATAYLSFDTDTNATDEIRIYDNGNLWSNTGVFSSAVADSATAVGYTLNTTNTLSTQGAKLLSIQNNSAEKFYLDKDGNLYVSGSLISGNGTSMLITNKSGGTVANRSLVVLDSSNNSSFTTTTTPYNKAGFGVVIGVGLGVTNDADGDGACDANDVCMVAYGGEVEVTTKNAATAAKGEYLFTSDTAGSAVASAKQYDGLVGVVSNTAGAGSGYLKMIFKVQTQVTAAAAIDKASKHNEYWLYANQYAKVGEGADTDTNLLNRGLAFDTLTDTTKIDSANTTASFNADVQKAGLIGGQTLSTSTTDNAGNTYLGSNTVNKVFYYDRTIKDSSPAVQVELGIDPNWYNGVTLNVATTSAQFSQNSTVPGQPKNPNLSPAYNGSLVKVTGNYSSNPRTIYITIKSPTTFDWTDYNGNAATAVTMTPGTAQTLTGTGVSVNFTNAFYNTGDVFKIASWFVEPASSTRSSKQQFPERSYVIAESTYLDIIDADTQKLWMRFTGATNNMVYAGGSYAFTSTTALNGAVYLGLNNNAGDGALYHIDFARDFRTNYSGSTSYNYNGAISQRNGALGQTANGNPSLVASTINDVSAAVIPNQPTQEVTVSGWGYIAGAASTTISETVNLPYKFNNVPKIAVSNIGQKSSGSAPTSPESCTDNDQNTNSTAYRSTASTFIALLGSTAGTNLSNAYYCYTWTATGQVSPRQFVAAATDGGASVINETDQSVANFLRDSDHADDLDINHVSLLDNGDLYMSLEDATTTSIQYVAAYYKVAGRTTGETSLAQYRNGFYQVQLSGNSWSTGGPVILGTANTDTVDSLNVTTGTSTVDGSSNTLYIGTTGGLSVIQEKQSGAAGSPPDSFDESNGSVKYYTKDYISEEMVGDIRGMWPLSANGALSMSDASIKADTLTNNGTATAITGVRGAGVSLNGTTQYLSCTDAACGGTSKLDSGGNTWSFGAWFKTSTAAQQGIINKYNSSVSGAYRMYIDSSNKIVAHIEISPYTATSNTSVTDGLWHYAVASYNGSVLGLYIDGKLEASTAMSGSMSDTSSNFSIGALIAAGSATNYFNGTIDEPFVTAKALTANEVKHMYETGYRALQSHATTLGGGAADANQQLGYISTGTSALGDARPDWNNQFMYVGTNSTTLGAVSKIDLNSDTNIKTYNSSANVPTGGALLIDEDTKSLAVGYNLEAVGSAASGVKTMGVDNNATATSGNFIGKTITTAESFTQAYLWAQYTLDASDASNTIQVWASNDGGSNYYQCNLTNTDSSRSPSEYEYFCQFNAPGSSLKTKFVMARGSTKTNSYVSRYGIAWIDSSAVAGGAAGSGLYTATNASVANGSYVELAHNQNSNDLSTTGWVYNSSTNQWEDINNSTASAQIQNTTGGNLVKNFPSLEKTDAAQPEWWEEQDANVTLTEEDATGESIPDKTERVLKIVNGVSGANKYVYQTFAHADENLLDDSTTLVSAGVWVYTANAGTVTLELYNNGGSASLGTATTTTTGSWQYLRVEGKTIGTTSTDLRIYHSANSATTYVTMPQFNVGPQVQSWSERPTKDIRVNPDISLSTTTTAQAFTDVDATANTSNLTVGLFVDLYLVDTTLNVSAVRPNGTTWSNSAFRNTVEAGGYGNNSGYVPTDDGQVIEYFLNTNADDARLVMTGYREWATGSPGPVNSPFYIQQVDANTVRLYNYSGATQNLRVDAVTGGLGRNAGTVSLAPAAADVDSQSNTNSIWINKTGSGGNLLKLQTSGADVLSLTSAGTMTLTGNFLPGTDNTYALGSTSARWKDLFLGPASLHISSTTGTSGVGANYVDGTIGYTSNALTLTTAVTGTVAGGGSINLTSGLAAGNTTTSAFNLTTSADLSATDEILQVGDSAGTFMTVLGNGNVGINTTGPDRKLDVLDANNPQLRLTQTDGTVYADFQMNSNGDLVMNVDGVSNQLVLDNGGGVGIGTAAPSQKLTIQQDAVADLLGVYDGANNTSLLLADGGTATFKPSAFDKVFNFDGSVTYTDNTTEAKTISGTPFTLLVNSSNYLYLGLDHKFSTVYFDIATALSGSSPVLVPQYYNGAWTTLAVTDNTSVFTQDGAITFTAPSDWATTTVNSVSGKYWVRFSITYSGLSTAPTAYSVSPTTGSRLYAYAQSGDSTPTFYINDQGRVGINDATPDVNYKLEVWGAIGAQAFYDADPVDKTSYGLDPAASSGTPFGDGTYSLKTAGGALLAYLTGQVGIGNQTPVGKLDVRGQVTGKALTILNELGDQAIFTASASGVTKFVINNDGSIRLASDISSTTNTQEGTIFYDNDSAGSSATDHLFLRGSDSAWHRIALDMTKYSSTAANITNQSYIQVAHNQNTNDIGLTGWFYDTVTSLWKNIKERYATIDHDLDNEFNPPFTDKKKTDQVQIQYNENNLGNGADGAATFSSDTNINTSTGVGRTCADAVNYSVSALAPTTATLEQSPSSSCLAAGDEVLLINLRGTGSAFGNVGNYETLRVSSISTNVVTFTTSKTKYYGDGASDDTNIGLGTSNQTVMLQRVPNYTSVAVSTANTDLTPSEWTAPSGSADANTETSAAGAGEGGIMFFRATGTVSVAASTTINANAKGYIGGAGSTSYGAGGIGGEAFCGTNGTAGANGGSYTPTNATTPYCGAGGGAGRYYTASNNSTSAASNGTANLGGAGGGGGSSYGTAGAMPGGGGGGGYGTYGYGGEAYLGWGSGATNGTDGGTNQSGNGGVSAPYYSAAYYGVSGGGGGGGTYGDANLTDLMFGSAGAGAGVGNGAGEGTGGTGGDGAGIVYIAANSVTVSGGIQSNGGAGTNGSGSWAHGGGGGAGGSVKIVGNTLNLGSSLVTASNGVGGTGTGGGPGSGYNGGAGGNGRIAVYYSTSISGTTSPTYDSNTLEYNTYALFVGEEIPVPGATAFSNISWTETLASGTEIQFQTRSGNTSDSTDGSWEGWKPITSSTTLQTANTHTDFTGTNMTVADGDVTRNINYFEDEDESTSGNLTKGTATAANGYAEITIASTDISSYQYITLWVRSTLAGNSIKIGFGEAAGTEQEETVTINAIDTWQKVYWDISDVTGTSRDGVTKLRITSTQNSAVIYFDNIKAESYLTTTGGSTITSTANNYIQYRAIMTTTNTANTPVLSAIRIALTNASGSVTIDADRVRNVKDINYYTSGRLNITETNLDNIKSNRADIAQTSVSQLPDINPGTGADGAITVSSNSSINVMNLISGRSCVDGGDAVNYSVTGLTSTTATLESAPSTGCLAVGDEVLLINLRGTNTAFGNVGNFETLTVQSIASNVVTFTTSKTKYYGGGASDDTNVGVGTTAQAVMLQRVPNYTTVTVNASINFYPDAWVAPTGAVNNGAGEGGVMFFRATGAVAVNGTIHANAKGYIGGAGAADYGSGGKGGEAFCGTNGTAGANGGSYTPTNATTPYCGAGGGAGRYYTASNNSTSAASNGTANLGGAGGGGGSSYGTAGAMPGGGGGGGYGTYGYGGEAYLSWGSGATNGTDGGTNQSGNGGVSGPYFSADYYGVSGGGGGGGTYGDANLNQLFFGAGGGGPGSGNGAGAGTAGAGGNGAGIVYIAANSVTVSGGIQSNGGAGTLGSAGWKHGGGGGAGGSIKIVGNTINLGSSLVTASYGSGGIFASGYNGGNGGSGRIAVYYADAISGSTSPAGQSASTPNYPYTLFISDEVATPNATEYNKIRWTGDEDSYGMIRFQTRSGKSNNSTDGTWEGWKPVVANTNVKSLENANTHTNWTGTNATVEDGSGSTTGVYYTYNEIWTKYSNAVPSNSDTSSTNGRIPLGSAGRADDGQASYPTIIKDGLTYKMWYGGWDGVSAYYILYATSSDGLTWTKYDNTVPSASDTTSTNGRIPLGTAGKGDDAQVFQASVILDGSTYKMWYSAYDGTNYRIYYATSPDGLTWTKYDNTIPTNSDTSSTNGRIPLGTNGTGDDTNVYGVSVIKDGSTYKMWYGGHDGSTQRIYYATSPDGLTWTKYNNAIPSNSDTTGTDGRIPLGTAGKGDDGHTQYPAVAKDGSTYKMWYGGYDGSTQRIYYATSPDGLTWTKYDNTVPSNSDTSSTNGRIPLGTNTTGDDTQAVPPGILIDGTTYKIWYGGSDGSNGRTYYATMTATTNSVPPASDPTRNVNFFEDEDESSSNNFTRIFTTGTANGYAEATISSADLSTYDYVTAWVFSSKAGNEIKLGIGESAATEQTETVYVDSANVWQKVYWDITDIPYDQRDAITKLRITVTEVGTNTYIDNITADRYLTNSAGSTISSTPDEYIQYRAILTTTNSAYRPKLYDAKIEWGNGFKIQQTDANTVRLYNYTGETQQLRLDAVVFGADLAEYYTVNDQSIGAGDVVAMTGQLDEYGVPILRKTNRINDPDIAGVISTLAGQTLGLEAEDRRLLGLAGRVPVKVASDSPAISAGDLLTSSDEEGKARRARPGDKTIGKALENWGPDSGKDQVLMLIGNSIALPSFGDISDLVVEKVEDLGKTTYQLVDAAGEKLENVAAYSQAVIANLTAGSIEAEKISSPIIETVDIVATGTAQLNKIETNEIKPVEKDLVINLDREFSIDSNDNSSSTSGELAKIIIKGLEGKTVTTIDDAGNASFSGQVVAQSLSIRDDATVSGTLYANELKTNEASISGKLTAKEIEADNLTDLANRLAVTANDSSALASNVNEIQTLLADIQNNPVPDPDNYQNIDDELFSINSNDITTQELTVVGNSNLYNVSVSGSIIAGTTLIENNSITSLASELKFSALSKINFFDGAVTVARDGTITTRGELIAEGGIKTAEIKPINDTVTLAGNLDVKGDLILNKYLEATDSASIIAAADNFEVNGIFSPAIETATSSAGVALMPANSSEVIIYNNTIKRDSLVYLTPTSEAPLNNQLTVSEKQDCIGSSTCKKYFKVVINIPPTTPTKFNWLIVN